MNRWQDKIDWNWYAQHEREFLLGAVAVVLLIMWALTKL